MLRDQFGVNVDDGQGYRLAEQASANGMGEMRRGLHGALLGADANAALIDEASLRAAGHNDEADAKAAQVQALRERMAVYAPRVGRYEDIHGVGDAVDYAAGQMGNAAGSMAPALAFTTAGQLAGTALRVLPQTRGLARLAPLLGGAAGFGYNQRQMAGDMYGRLRDDPQAMANLTPQQAYHMANLESVPAAMLDTWVPGKVGSALGGAALRQAAAKAGGGFIKHSLTEGATQGAQELLAQGAHSLANPNRDTSGDMSELLNSALGGAIGSTPMTGAGALAHSAWSRAGHAGEAVKNKAGEVVDTVTGATDQARSQAKERLVDLRAAQEERDALADPMPPEGLDGEALKDWAVAAASRRKDYVQARMEDLVQRGVPEAEGFLSRLNGDDPMEHMKATDEGAQFLLERNDAASVQHKADAFDSATKKNMQGTLDYASWEKLRGESAPTHAIQRAAQQRQKQSAPATPSGERASMFAETMAADAGEGRTKNYVRSLGYELSDMADSWDGKNGGKHLGLLLGDIREVFGKKTKNVLQRLEQAADPATAKFLQVAQAQEQQPSRNWQTALQDRMVAQLPQDVQASMQANNGEGAARLFDAVQTISRGRAEPGLRRQLEKIVGPGRLNKMLTTLGETLDPKREGAGREQSDPFGPWDEHRAADEAQAAQEPHGVFGEHDAGARSEGEIRDEAKTEGERDLKRAQGPRMYAFYGEQPQSLRTTDSENRRAARNPFEPLQKMTAAEATAAQASAQEQGLNGFTPVPRPRLARPGDSAVVAASLQRKVQEVEKTLGVDRTPENFFRLARKEYSNPKQRAQLDDLQQKFDAGDAGAKERVDQAVKQFFEDRAGDHVVSAVSAKEVMNELGFTPSQRLALFRDYMVQEGQRAKESAPDRARKYFSLARDASKRLLDAKAESLGRAGIPGAPGPRLAEPGRRMLDTAMERYFGGGYLVRAQSPDRVPGKMGTGELIEMARAGARARDAVRGMAAKAGSATVAGSMRHEVETGLLNFPQREGGNLMGTKDKTLSIKADNLVAWVRNQRREEVESTGNAARDYLRDLKDGIAAVTAMDGVDGLPWVNGPKGREHFTDTRVPDSLALADRTGAGVNRVREIRAEKQSEGTKAERAAFKRSVAEKGVPAEDVQRQWQESADRRRSKEVAKEQAKHEEPFVADPYEKVDAATYRREGVIDPYAERPDSVQVLTRAVGPGKEVARDNPHSVALSYDKSGHERERAQLDAEAQDVRKRSRDAADIPKEPKKDAVRLAAERAGQIVVHTGDEKVASVDGKGRPIRVERSIDVAATLDNIRARLNAATKGLAPGTGGEKYGYKFGYRPQPHMAYPLAHALSAENAVTLLKNATREQRREITALQASTAKELLQAPAGARLQLARAMAGAGEHIQNYEHAVDFLKELARGGETQPQEGATKAKPHAVQAAVQDRAAAQKPTHAVREAVQAREEKLPPGAIDLKTHDPNAIVWAAIDPHGDRDDARVLAAFKSMDAAQKFAEAHGANLEQNFVRKLSDRAAQEVAAREGPKPGDAQHAVARAVQERKLNAQNTLPSSDDARQRLVSRLADNLAERYAAHRRGDTAVYEEVGQDRSRLGDAGTIVHFSSGDGDSTFSVGVPQELVADLRRTLSRLPESKHRDALAYYGVQHALYDLKTHEFQSFGPRPDSPGGRFLSERGALGFTGETLRGQPITRAEGATSRQTADFLAHALAFAKQHTGNDRLPVEWKRLTGARPGKEGSGLFNAQHVGEHPAPSDADVQQARDYLHKTLGPQVKSEFEKITGFSGEWIEPENLVRVSTLTGAGVLNVARHEAIHAFWSKFVKDNPKAQRILGSLTDDPRVMRRLESLLKNEPEALKQLADGQERLAYIHQFAMAGLMRLPHTPGTTLMAKVRKFLRRAFMMVGDQERAVDMLYSFERGEMSQPSAAGRVLAAHMDQGTWLKQGARAIDGFAQRFAALTVPAHEILANSASPTARKLAETFFTNPGGETSAKEPGYLNARNQMMRTYDNLFRKAIDGLEQGQMSELLEAMQRERPTSSLSDPDVAQAKERLHALFDRFHRYMTVEKGVEMGKIEKNYWPVVWDSQALASNPGPLQDLLLSDKYRGQVEAVAADWNKAQSEHHAKLSGQGAPPMPYDAKRVIQALISNLTRSEGVQDSAVGSIPREDGVLRPWMAASEKRILNFLDPGDRAPFLEKNIVRTLSRYVRQGVRTAEYSSRFGRRGELLDQQLQTIKGELEATAKTMLQSGDLKDQKAADAWAARQYRDVANSTGAMEGTLGGDVSNFVRKANSLGIVYQNVRLLPLALFSSFVDPLGIITRGGELREAFDGFVSGIKGVARQWGDMIREEPPQRQKSRWEELAEHAGVIDAATFSHLLSDEYGSVYLDGTAKKINQTMFKLNGMEAWNRAMRVAATRAAVNFIQRHVSQPGEHSERWLNDLGFGKDRPPPMDADGQLVTNKRVLMAQDPALTLEQAEQKIHEVNSAIVRWVEGAILSPNAAQRPAWASDPHYSMLWHLKQFAYSFHQTLIKRARVEAKYGNYMPLGVFAWYIPTMIAADLTKGLMLGGGELPNYMKGYNLGDWVEHGVDRAGILGIGQTGVDAVQNPASLGGPMFEQIADIVMHPEHHNVVNALPAHALYAQALR
jgi:hypothetical protein